MPTKTVYVSSDPNYVPFPQWTSNLLNSLIEANDTAELEKLQTALSLKDAANNEAGIQTQEDGSVVQNSSSAPVPEFNEYFNRWMGIYNVTFQVEEI